MGVLAVVPQGLTIRALVFLPEVGAAALFPGEGIAQHQLGQPEEIGHPQPLLQLGIRTGDIARDPHITMEPLLQSRQFRQSGAQAFRIPGDAAALDHQISQFTVEGIHRCAAPHSQQTIDASAGLLKGVTAGGVISLDVSG